MLDVAYIALTLVFFGLMLAYVRACDALGRWQDGEERERYGDRTRSNTVTMCGST